MWSNIYHDILYSTEVMKVEHKPESELTNDLHNFDFKGELWGVLCMDFWENWTHHYTVSPYLVKMFGDP